MDDDLDDSTMCNYPVYFSDYYDIVKNKLVINQNPVEAALDEFDWYRSNSDPMPLTEEQLTDIWNTLESLENCPVQGYDLDNWCLWMKMLIVFLIAVGPRSNEVVNLDVETQMKFDDDPRVVFTQRKNLRRNEGPEEVPIMMGIEFLRAYQDYISMVDHNGKLVPSPESESGSRSANTLNNWLKRLCKKANVRLEDGTLPTMKNFRQTWTTLYKKTIHENREQIKFVSGEKGTKNHQVDEDHYLREVSNRRELRELGRKHFENLLNIESIPNLLEEKLDEQEYYERQTRFYDF
jgi:integrase